MTHALKTWPLFFQRIESGQKTFELRKNDRDYKVGDRVLLQEWDPAEKKYTGKELERVISYILINAEEFGLKKGYIIFGLGNIEHYV